MSSERDINKLIAQRRRRYLGEAVADDEDGDLDEDEFVASDDEEDETSVIIMTDYYGYDDIVSEFFRSFYSGEITINADTYRVTMKLACQYEVSWVISECCSFLETFLNEDNFIDNYKFLMNFKNDNIASTTLGKLLSFDYHTLLNHHEPLSSNWFNMDEHLFTTLLDHLLPPSEMYITHLLFLWLEFDEPHRKCKFETLIQNLRLVHVSQSFVGEVVLKYAEVHGVESKALYRMVLGAQSYFFSQMAGVPPRRPAVDLFPKIYESRSSFVRNEEFSFSIPVESIRLGHFEIDEVSLIVDQGYFKLVFKRNCCFVFITNSAIVEKYSVSRLLIPVSRTSINEDDHAFVSKDIDIFGDVIATSDELGLANIDMVAVILDSNN